MFQELYLWLEQYTGVSYDFRDDVLKISAESIFIEPYEWSVNVKDILTKLNDVNDTIDEYGDELPDSYPDKNKLKKFITENVIGWIVDIVNSIKKQLNIEVTEISDYDDLLSQCSSLVDFIQLINNNNIKDGSITDKDFEEFNEEHNEILTETFHISKNDIPSIQATISTIKENFYDSLEEYE